MPRATVMAGPVVLSRTVPTARSIASAAAAGQSEDSPPLEPSARGPGVVPSAIAAHTRGRAPARPLVPYTVRRVTRTLLGLLCGAAVAAVGALILGEYE